VSASRPFLPLLLVLFVGSGCAALIYEIVWLQLLQLVIGSTAISLAVLLGTFMGGMCLGSLLLPWVISRNWHPLRVYALLELGIGVIGIGILFGMPSVEAMYTTRGGPGVLLRGLVAGMCLLPPTLLMGATLPAIARWVETTPQGVSWLGFFYGGNIAGAVFGCLLAGFYLLRVHDMAVATYAALALNLTVAFLALMLSLVATAEDSKTSEDGETSEVSTPVERARGGWAIYLTIALSGLAALGAEVVWTRLMSLMLGGTVYTFSIILAVFLIGLGIGSSVGAWLGRRTASARLVLGACQLLLTGAILWTAYMISRSLPYWPINPQLARDPWDAFQLDLVRCLWAVLPPACLWGASFPLALAALAARGQDPGRLVGGVYAANTLGAIIGALAFGMLVVPAIGTLGAQRLLVGLSAVAALLALAPVLLPALGDLPPAWQSREAGVGAALGLMLALGTAGWLSYHMSPMPWGTVAYGRYMPTYFNLEQGIRDEADVPQDTGPMKTYCTYVGEGMNVSVAVTKTNWGVRSFHGAGKVQASNDPHDMRVQRMMGHIPALLHKKPESVLVVACGAGVTAGCFVLHPDVKRLVICDIEPLVPKTVTPMFSKENYGVVDGIAEENPRTIKRQGMQDLTVEVVYDDGRHFLRTTKEKFDIITSDPIDPWVKGCAALNTVEYYQMAKDHLKEGGNVSLWIPFYECNLDTAKSVLATFFKVFPDGILWSNDREYRGEREGYDAMLFGFGEPTPIDVDALERRLDLKKSPAHQRVVESLDDVGFGRAKTPSGGAWSWHGPAIDLLATFAGQGALLEKWAEDAQINTDRNLRLQYLAGMWLNRFENKKIFDSILEWYTFPEKTFVGKPDSIRRLKEALKAEGRKEPWE
jgi:spermidine synthase